MLHSCYIRVTFVLHSCYIRVTIVLQSCYKRVTGRDIDDELSAAETTNIAAQSKMLNDIKRN